MSDHSDDQGSCGSSGISGAETDRYGFLLGNGETNSSSDEPCPQVVRQREMKWLTLMNQWDQVLEKKTSKIKGQCQKGIPASVRAKCWPLLCGATHRKKNNEKLYETLEKAPGQQSWIDVIKRDTDRQFPFHEMFLNKDSHGQQGLLQVLKVYTQFRPEEGYCQAQGPVAAVLLMNMPIEEAFWCLVQICELYLPGYYSPLLEGVLFDAALLSGILKRTCPAAYKHLQSQGVEPLMFATDWLMCLYSRHLPFNTLLRVWDLFFCYGVRVLFQVAAVLVRRCLGEARQRKECEGQMETLEKLRAVRGRVQHEPADAFIQEVCSVPLSLGDLQKQTEKELKKWKKERPGSTFDPRHRCHGYHMVWEKGKEKKTEKEKLSGNLTVPLTRSHSSLTPTLLRRKWRKGGSKVETEEWEGGGRRFSQGIQEEGFGREQRTRSMCSMAEEFTTSRDSVTYETDKQFQKDCNKFTDPRLRQCGQLDMWSSSELSDHSAPVFEEEEEVSDVCTTTGTPQSNISDTDSIQTQQEKDKEDIQTDRGGQNNEMQPHREGEGDREEVEKPQQEDETLGKSNIQVEELTERGNIQKEKIQNSTCEQQDSTKLENKENQADSEKQLEKTESNIKQSEVKEVEEIEVQEAKEKEMHPDSIKRLEKPGLQDKKEKEEEMHLDRKEGLDEPEVQEKKEEEMQPDRREGLEEQEVHEEKEMHPDRREELEQEEKEEDMHPDRMKQVIEAEEEEKIHLENKQQDEEQTQHEEHIETDPILELDNSRKAKKIDVNSSKQEAKVSDCNRQDEGKQTTSQDKDQALTEEKLQPEEDTEDANKEPEKLRTTEDQEHLPLPPQEEDDVQRQEVEEDISHTNVCESTRVQEGLALERELPKEMETKATDNSEKSEGRSVKAVEVEDSEVDDPNRDHTVDEETLQRSELKPSSTSDPSQANESYSIPQIERMPKLETEHKTDENELMLRTRTMSSPTIPHVQQETGSLEPMRTTPSEYSHVEESSPQREEISNLKGDHKVDEQEAKLEHSRLLESSQGMESLSQLENTGNEEATTIPAAQPGIPKPDKLSKTGESSEYDAEVVVLRNVEGENKPVSVISHSATPDTPSRPTSTGSSSNPNTHLRLRRSSSSLSSHPSILSEDTFKDPQNIDKQGLNSEQEHKAEAESSTTNLAQQSQMPEPDAAKVTTADQSKTLTLSQAGKPKRRGLFHRFRGETPSNSPVPKIVIQDFSEGKEKLSSKERRRRRREQERKEKEEEKERKKQEKELEKQKERERKTPQTRGKSFQVPSRKDNDSDSSAYKGGSQTLRSKRNSAPHSENYF